MECINYYKDHRPSKEQLEAVEREDGRRRISCARILETHFKKEMENKLNRLKKKR